MLDLEKLEWVFDSECIRQCLARYCTGIDRLEPGLVMSCYWPGAIDDHSIFVGNVNDYVPWVMAAVRAMKITVHNLGHSRIDIKGSTAAVETYFTAYHRLRSADGAKEIMLGARYIDHFEKRSGTWRILHRRLVNDWIRTLAGAEDFTDGLIGTPFLHDGAVGKAVDDPGLRFFRSTLTPPLSRVCT